MNLVSLGAAAVMYVYMYVCVHVYVCVCTVSPRYSRLHYPRFRLSARTCYVTFLSIHDISFQLSAKKGRRLFRVNSQSATP